MDTLFKSIESHKIVYGCMGSSGVLGAQEVSDSIGALQSAYDIGLRFFDTAEMYGDGYSEQLINMALGSKRKDLIISSKVSPEHLSHDGIIEACNRSLRNLNTDYIDLYLLHWPSREIPLEESIETLKELQKEGKILKYGVSNFGELDLQDAMKLGELSAEQVGYNLFQRAIEFSVLPLCKSNSIPVMCYSALMQGLLTGKYETLAEFPKERARTRLFDSKKNSLIRHGESGCEDEASAVYLELKKISKESGIHMGELAIGWLKKQDGVGGIQISTRNAKQSLDLQRYMNVELDDDVLSALTLATESVKQKLGPNIDMWAHRTK